MAKAKKKVTRKKATAKKKTHWHRKSADDDAGGGRGLWSGNISFGLISIPVKLISAREQSDLRFTMLDPKNLSPVGYKYYNKSTGKELSRGDTVKAFEHKKGSYVIMTDADFKKANPEATQTIDIENFVELSEIDPVFFEKAYYLTPRKGGEKAYHLLCAALEKSQKVAIAKIVLHTKQHLVAVMPRGSYLLLELLHFAEDVKELRDLSDLSLGASKAISREVEMAEKLIEDMTSKWKPEQYKDTYREDVMKMVQKKVKSGKATEITKDYAEKDSEPTGQVLDLMPLLKKSLESKKRSSSAGKSRRVAMH